MVIFVGTLGQIAASEAGLIDLLRPIGIPEWSPLLPGSQVQLFELWMTFLLLSPSAIFLAAYLANRSFSR
jgi:hypothetical protein